MSLRSLPVVGDFAVCFKRSVVNRLSWRQNKKEILAAVRQGFDTKRSLDLSVRYNHFVFHDRANSLIKRGEIFEPEITECLSFLFNLDKLRGNRTVFADIGANIGLHTFFTLRHFPDVKIAAFDPSPSSWKYLELSLDYNKIGNVTLHRFALSDSTGQTEFYNWGEESSADSIRNTGRVHSVQPNVIQVEKKRMDDLEGPFTVFKMDCEGAELGILRGARETILKYRPLIVCEFNPTNIKAFSVRPEDIFSYVEEIGYSMYSLEYRRLGLPDFIALQNQNEENYILLPNGLLQTCLQ